MRFLRLFLSSVCCFVAFLSSSTESRGQTPGYQWANFVGLPGGPGNADAVGSIARFHDAYGVAVDANGNVYIADSSNDAIRQITPNGTNGTTTTFAGYTEANGFKNATGTAARLDGPRGVAFDSSGNLYVTEYYNNCVRMITPSGVVTTFAGSRTFGNLDGPAATAEFNGPHGITVDSSGVVYVADTGNHTIRKIAGGMVTTISPQSNLITCVVTAQDGTTTQTYKITVTRIAVPPSALTYAANPAIYTKGVAITNNTPSNAGDPVVSYVVSPSLPAGLSLDTSAGVISGTPTAITATAAYTITATNTGGFTTAAVTITVNDVAPSSLTYSPNPAVYTRGLPIIGNAPTSSGGLVVSYAVSPPLPAGLKLNTASGMISGTPTTITSSAVYTVTATNTGGSATALVTITVNDVAPSSLSYSTNPAVYTKGAAITSNNPASNGGPVVSYAVSPPLPNGLALNPGTGVITGTPTVVTPSAVYTVTATNTGGSAMAAVTITVNDVPPSSLSYSINPAIYTKSVAIVSNNPTSSGGPVVSYTVSPPLPAGLTLDPGAGAITGAPTVITSSAMYTVTAANTGGSTKVTITITVNDVAPSALIYSANPVTYTQGTTIASNTPGNSGGAVVSYSILPALPAGLSLSPTTGVITGAPTAAAQLATGSYTVTATNTGGSTTATLSLTIIGTLPVATSQAVQAQTHLPLAITLSALEPVTLPTTYKVLTQPLHGVLSGTAPNLKYTSAPAYTGSDSLTFQVTDEVGTSQPATVAITVIPPVSKQGHYSGHFVGLISGTEPANSGTITITSVGTGAFTGSILFGGATYALKGSYNTDGVYPISIARKGLSALTGNLSFGLPPGSDGITGAVGGSTLAASSTIYSPTAPTSLAGRYTVKIPSDSTQTDGSKTPQGYSVGTLVVASSGTITFAGTLADGTKFTRGTSLTRGGVWYLFLPLYATTGPLEGMLEGTIPFATTPQVSDLDGAVTWVRPALTKLPPPATAFYPAGFSLSTHLYGTAYSSKGSLVVTPASSGNTFTAAGGSVPGGSLSQPATAGKAAVSFKLTGADNLSLTLTESSGIVAGSFKETMASLSSPVNAIIYQNGSAPSIIGNFTDRPKGGTNEGGGVTLTSP